MNALEMHDEKIGNAIRAMVKAYSNKNWYVIYDINKHLNKLIKDRKQYMYYKNKEN